MRPLPWLLLVACNAGGPDADTGAPDADGDGATGADDCDDADPDRHPGALDTWGDFVDSNCDGIDGTGVRAGAAASAVVLGKEAYNQCTALAPADFDGDGLANDLAIGCPAGYTDENQSGYAAVLFQPAKTATAGTDGALYEWFDSGTHSVGGSVAALHDAGDAATLIIGDSFRLDAWFLEAPLSSADLKDIPPDIACTFYQGAQDCAAAIGQFTRVIPDSTGDGFEDLLVPAEGNVFTIQGFAWWAEANSDLDPANPTGFLVGGDPSAGIGVGPAGDPNGDGLPDLMASDGRYSAGDPLTCLLISPTPGTHPVADLALATFSGEASEDRGCDGPGISAGDVDADGYDDLLFGAEFHGEERQGRAYLFYGPPGAQQSLADAAATFDGPEAFDQVGLGQFAAGDLDGDGFPELAIPAPQNYLFTDHPGHVFVFSDVPRGALSADDARAVWVGEPGDMFGALGASTDFDGDGDTELWIGAIQGTAPGLGPNAPDLYGAGMFYLLDLE